MALELNRLKHPDTDIIVFEPGKKEALYGLDRGMDMIIIHAAADAVYDSSYLFLETI